MNTHAITVLMPVYNAEKYLREAIESILSQTFTDFEFMIINDGSTDGSEAIIQSYNDPRIRYIKNENNIQLIATLNKGIELSITKYIVRMDADDISVSNRLQVQFKFMEENTDVAVCGSWFEIIGNSERIIRYVASHESIMLKMLYQCHLCHPSVIMRKQMIDSFADKFDNKMRHAEDYDFFTRIGTKYKLANIQQVLLRYRQHADSVSTKYKQLQDDNSLHIKRRLFSEIGIAVDDEELEVFRKIAQHEYQNDTRFLHTAHILLERMLAANEKSGFFNRPFLKSSLAAFWFNVCYNLAPLGFYVQKKYYRSVLSQYHSLSVVKQIKFISKTILK